MKTWKPSIFVLIVFVTAAMSGAYKWTDDNGNIHYSDKAPSDQKAKQIYFPKQVTSAPAPEHEKQRKSQPQDLSLSLYDLGPLPKNESSKFVETSGTGVLIDPVKLAGRFYISLLAKYSLPNGAYLEARFEDPENTNNQIVVEQERQRNEKTVNISSPLFKGLKCRNYEVAVNIYADKSKSKFLGSHQQRIQSRINLDKVKKHIQSINSDKVKTLEVLIGVMKSGNCP